MENKCLNYEEKKIFLLKINKFYKYNENIINKYLNDKYLFCKYHNYKNLNNYNNLLIILQQVSKYLNDNNIEYFINQGTLIGCMRNNKLLEYDYDIDIGILKKYYKILIKKIYKLKKINIYIKNKYVDVYYCNINNLIFNIKYDEEKTINKKYPLLIKIYLYNNNIISKNYCDIILYFKNKDKNKYISNYKNDKVSYINMDELYPLKYNKIENNSYPIINNPIKFLNRSYYFWKHIDYNNYKKNIYYILPKYYKYTNFKD